MSGRHWTKWSDELKQNIEVWEFCGVYTARTSDGVVYVNSELQAASREKVKIPYEVHEVKRAFGGTLVTIGAKK